MDRKRAVLIVLLAISIGALLFAFWQNSNVSETDSDLRNDGSDATLEIPEDNLPDNQNPDQTQPSDLEQEFTSQLWVLESIDLSGKRVNMDVNISKPLILEFDLAKKSYGGFGGCNGFGGEYVFEQPYDFDFGLTVSTQIYCEGGASEMEQAYFQAIDKVTNVGIKGNQLVFTDESPNTTQLVYNLSK